MSTHDLGIELFRTFVTVVETRSFTKAAAVLDISQPTVSGHVRRLQEQLAAELFDKTAPGVRLTRQGEVVLSYARQILAANDELFDRVDQAKRVTEEIRIGIPPELRCAAIVPALAEFRSTHPNVVFELTREPSKNLLRQVQLGHIDVCIGLTVAKMSEWALHSWTEKLDWVGAPAAPVGNPVHIVAHANDSALRDIMVSALREAQIDYQVVFGGRHIEGVMAAAAAGLGHTVLLHSLVAPNVSVLPDGRGLPALPDAHWGLFVNQERRSDLADRVSGAIATVIRPGP